MAEIEPASDELVDAIERGIKGVTPGPWLDYEHCWFRYGVKNESGLHVVQPTTYREDKGGAVNRTVAAHIARMSPDNIAAILARLRKAEKERDALNDSMAIYVDAEIVELIRARARGIARAKGGGDG